MGTEVCLATSTVHGYKDVGRATETRTTRPSQFVQRTSRPSQLVTKTFAKGTKSDGVGKSLKMRVRKKPPTLEEMLIRKRENFKSAFETEVAKFMSIPGVGLAMAALGLKDHDKELLQEMQNRVVKVTTFQELFKALEECERRMGEYKDYFKIMDSFKKMIDDGKKELEPWLKKESRKEV